jgi:hypothetical protein
MTMKTKNNINKFIEESYPWAQEHTLNDKLVMPRKIKIKVLDFPQFYSKPIEEVKKHLEENCIKRLPDLRIMAEIWNDIDSYPELKQFNWQYNFFFGSTLRDGYGFWRVPRVLWVGGGFLRSADWLGRVWDSRCRVVLLDDSAIDSLPSLSYDPLNLAALEKRVAELEAWKEKVEKIAKLMTRSLLSAGGGGLKTTGFRKGGMEVSTSRILFACSIQSISKEVHCRGEKRTSGAREVRCSNRYDKNLA